MPRLKIFLIRHKFRKAETRCRTLEKVTYLLNVKLTLDDTAFFHVWVYNLFDPRHY